jgi:hypothetical protein
VALGSDPRPPTCSRSPCKLPGEIWNARTLARARGSVHTGRRRGTLNRCSGRRDAGVGTNRPRAHVHPPVDRHRKAVQDDQEHRPHDSFVLRLIQVGIASRSSVPGWPPPSTPRRTRALLQGAAPHYARWRTRLAVRSPRARVVLVDYLTVLLPAGAPAPPLSSDHADVIRRIATRFRDATAEAATAEGCLLVAAAAASADHHAWAHDPWTAGAAWPLPWRPAGVPHQCKRHACRGRPRDPVTGVTGR